MLKVKIKDFQSVADTEFDVDGFTVIVGKNNRGKSAIVRAIDAALSNRLGNNFIRWGKLQTEVGLVKGDLDLSWVKEEKTASYSINKKSYTSLNRAVPKPITDAGYKKFEIGDEKLNPLIAHQFEELFLINRSGPFVTEAISTLYDLNDINDADSLCQKKLRASKNLLKTRVTDSEALTAKLEKFKGIDEIKKKWDEIKEVIEKTNSLKSELVYLESRSTSFQNQTALVDELKPVGKFKIPVIKGAETALTDYIWVDGIDKKLSLSQRISNKLQGVPGLAVPDLGKPRQLIESFDWLDSTIKAFQRSLQIVQRLKEQTPLIVPDIKKTETLIQEISDLMSLVIKLNNTTGSCDKCKSALEELKGLGAISEKLKTIGTQVDSISYLTKTNDDFSSMVKSFKDLKVSYDSAVQEFEASDSELRTYKICPLCNNPLEHTHG